MINASLTKDNRLDDMNAFDLEYSERDKTELSEAYCQHMSGYIDRIENKKDPPIAYTINIKTLSTSKRPLTCYITTKPRQSNPLNYIKPSICLEKCKDIKSRSTIHLPVTYSSSVHLPCRPPLTLPKSSSPHHYHHYHHHHYYHHHHHRQSLPQSSQPSTAIKPKVLPRSTSNPSTRPTTTPDSSSSSLPTKKLRKHTSTFPTPKKPPTPPPPALPSYSTLVWNWFQHSTPKTSPPSHKDSQSDYSEICRHEHSSKRSLLFKLLTSPAHKQPKSKTPRPCSTRKRFESSSSSLPNKNDPYHE